MKKAIMIAAALLAGAVLFSSCNKDDENRSSYSKLVKSAVGEYNVHGDVSGAAVASFDGLLNVVGVKSNKVNLRITDVNLGVISDLTIDAKEVTFSGTEGDIVVEKWENEVELHGLKYPIVLEGTIKARDNGTRATNRDADLEINLTMTVQISPAIGNKPAGFLNVAITNPITE